MKMKWIASCVVAISLLSPLDSARCFADAIPGPPVPTNPDNGFLKNSPLGVYEIAWGLVALTTAGSLVALRHIRKQNGR